ncbi:TetR/AcrR family transcriptional regulator [Cellulomonas sp. P22]|uniref:TetR/AcrR family transcriptional regulator n=1 Tax=Cellulomonas sp. P22 TaxID=3373189 RepID=UPI003793A04C
MSPTVPQRLRSDAQENRDRIVEAARELFAESGLDVTIRQVARRAGVGPATLYRRFPSKQDLVLAAFRSELVACRTIVTEGAADTDPWRGLCAVIERITVLNARNQGFTDAFRAEHPGEADFVEHRRELVGELSVLARRAQSAGMLRADFALDDFDLILLAGRGLARAPIATRADAARRFAALTIEGLRAAPTNTPLPAPARLASTIADPTL